MQKEDLSLAQLATLMAATKRAEGKTEKTLIWYENALMRRYVPWLKHQGKPLTLSSFTVDLVRAFIVDLQQQRAVGARGGTNDGKLSDQSVNSYVRALQSFSTWLYDEQYTNDKVLGRLKLPSMSKKVQDILTPEEIARIVASFSPRSEIGARDQAIFLLMLDTGMRAGELCSLQLDNLHLDQGYATVFGKGRKERPVKIGSRAARAVRFYLAHWRKPATPKIDRVFLSCTGVLQEGNILASMGGEPLTVNALGLMYRRIGKTAGVPRLHAHLLRHTFACMYLMQHRDPFALKSLLGHTTLAMTNHYCEAVRQMDVVRADAVSVIDSLDFRALDINRRGRLPKNTRKDS